MKIKSPQELKEIERAIIMLVEHVSKKCLNPKPVILHSIRVGMKLIELKQPNEVIIAGILHDLVEDTDCTMEEIKRDFCKKVADLVSAVTQEKIKDYKKRWHILMDKIKKAGRVAMVIKIVYMNENLPYVRLIKNQETFKITCWKLQFALDSLRPYIGNLKTFKEYEKKYKIITSKTEKK